MTDFGLNEKNIKILIDFFRGIEEIFEVKVYGSRAIGTYRNGSDIDFAIYGKINDDLISKIKYQIDELPMPYMFDITDYNTISNAKLKEHIEKFGKTFYKKGNV